MKTYLAVHTNKAVYHDAVAHTLEEWETILKEMNEEFENLRGFQLTEDNYEEE